MPSKYDAEVVLKLTRARIAHTFASCGQEIEIGDEYYKEDLGLLGNRPGRIMKSFCRACYGKKGYSVLQFSRGIGRTVKPGGDPQLDGTLDRYADGPAP